MITFLQHKQTEHCLFLLQKEKQTVRIQMVFVAVKRFIKGRVSPLYAIIVSTLQVGIMPSTAYLSLFDTFQTPSWSYATLLWILLNTYVRSFLSQDTKKAYAGCVSVWLSES